MAAAYCESAEWLRALAGDLHQAEALAARLQTEIAAVDITLRVFDPEQRPATIKARVKRRTPTRFRTGELTRTLLETLREASQPMTVREIARAVAAAQGLDVSTRKAMTTLVANTRAALSRPHHGLVREGAEGGYRWRLTL